MRTIVNKRHTQQYYVEVTLPLNFVRWKLHKAFRKLLNFKYFGFKILIKRANEALTIVRLCGKIITLEIYNIHKMCYHAIISLSFFFFGRALRKLWQNWIKAREFFVLDDIKRKYILELIRLIFDLWALPRRERISSMDMVTILRLLNEMRCKLQCSFILWRVLEE